MASLIGRMRDRGKVHVGEDFPHNVQSTYEPKDSSSHAIYIEAAPTVIGWFREQWPSTTEARNYAGSLIPFTRWILSYNVRWLTGDLIAGLTVGAIIIPQGMAYAKLAELPVQFGLYSSIMGGFTYWIFGTSKDISIGPAAVLATITGLVIQDVQRSLPTLALAPHEVASAITLISGIIVAVIGLLRLGFLVDLIPLAGVEAFVTGSALNIAVSQLPSLLGLRHIDTEGSIEQSLVHIFDKIYMTRGADAAVGITALTVLYLFKWGCAWSAKRFVRFGKSLTFLATLRTVLVILVYTLASFAINHTRKTDPAFAILGEIPSGFRDVAVPPLKSNLIGAILPNVPALAIVLLVEHLSVARSFGRVHNYQVNPSQEILAIGAANIAGSFLGAFPNTGSFSRTAVASKAGARTPMQGLVSATLVLIAVYSLMPAFFYVPNAALAGVIIHAVIDMITPPSHVLKYWRISPLDAFLFVVGVLVAVLKGIEPGVFATVGISLFLFLWRSFQAKGKFLGTAEVSTARLTTKLTDVSEETFAQTREGNKERGAADNPTTRSARESRTQFFDTTRSDGLNPSVSLGSAGPGIFVYRFSEGFNYTNANRQLDRLVSTIKSQTRATTSFTSLQPQDRPWNDPAPRKKPRILDYPENERPTLQAIILDMSAVGLVDLTAAQALLSVREELDRYAAPENVRWHFAGVRSRWTKRALVAAGFGSTADGTGIPVPVARTQTPPAIPSPSSGSSQSSYELVQLGRGKSGSKAAIVDVEAALGSNERIESLTEQADNQAKNHHKSEIQVIGVPEQLDAADQRPSMAPLYGTNWLCFHHDVEAALGYAMAATSHTARLRDSSKSTEDIV